MVIVIFVVIIETLIIVVIVMFIPKPITVSKYDSVETDYTVWESDETESYDILNPVFLVIMSFYPLVPYK